MTLYRVVHRTDYRYGTRVIAGQTVAHLAPRTTPWQRPVHWTIRTEPDTDDIRTHVDAFGNPTTYFAITKPHESLAVIATSEVEVASCEHLDAVDSGPPWDAPSVRPARSDADDLLARMCRLDSPLVAATDDLHAFAAPSFPAGRPVAEGAIDLMHRIFSGFAFDPNFSDLSTPLADVLEHRRGVCQDFAHLMIGCLRSHGLAARYVSGYIETQPPPGQPKLIGADASHAWCSLYVPGSGWLDLDPTNDHVRPCRHVTVAWGRDYGDVAPLRGVVFGPPGTQVLSVSVDVQRLPDGLAQRRPA